MKCIRIAAIQCTACGSIAKLETKECECGSASYSLIDAYFCKGCGKVYECEVTAMECCEHSHFQPRLRNNY